MECVTGMLQWCNRLCDNVVYVYVVFKFDMPSYLSSINHFLLLFFLSLFLFLHCLSRYFRVLTNSSEWWFKTSSASASSTTIAPLPLCAHMPLCFCTCFLVSLEILLRTVLCKCVVWAIFRARPRHTRPSHRFHSSRIFIVWCDLVYLRHSWPSHRFRSARLCLQF